MLRIKYITIVLVSAFIASCGGGGGEVEVEVEGECSIASQNQLVHELLLDKYLWYRDVPVELPSQLEYTDFNSPDEILDFFRADQDRFSYITDAAEFDSLFNQGQLIRYGFSFFINNDDTVQIKYVFDDSAAGRAGLARGDQILSINNISVEQISRTLDWDGIFGPNEEGYPVDMLIRKLNGDTMSVHMEKTLVNINTVLHHSIIPQENDTVGYLVFNSFLSTSVAELFNVFSDFKAAGVNKMILDLRYNGGGSVSVAQYLASNMRLTNVLTDLFTVLRFNDKHQHMNQDFFFKNLNHELDLEHVTIITTGATASASEMVINGLKPFVTVKTVGSTTVGKPVGMNPYEFCGKVILPITFAGYNHDGEGDYFDGFAADCSAKDDLDFSFGDVSGPMLSEALNVSLLNSCSANKPALKASSRNLARQPYSLQDLVDVY